MNRAKFFILALALLISVNYNFAQTGWNRQTNPIAPSLTNTLGKIQFVSASEGWISAPNGHLLHTTDAGAAWNIVTPFPNDTVSSVSDPSISMCWINNLQGWKINWIGTSLNDARGAVIHHTDDGGVTWTKKVLSTEAGDAGLQIQFVDANYGWAMIYNFSNGNAKFFKTSDGGNNWNAFNGKGIFYFADQNNGWAIYPAGNNIIPPVKIYHTANGGADWIEQYSDNTAGGFNAIQFTDNNNGWVVGDNGKILKTTNGGTTWVPITNTGIDPASQSKCVFFIDANTGWIGTNDGVLNLNPARIVLYTGDGGATWTKQAPPANNAVFSIFFLDKNTGWLTADNCVQNCDGADSLKIWQGAICNTITGGLTGTNKGNGQAPVDYILSQNYPNPFNPATTIKYSISKPAFVNLTVYDLLGRVINTLVNENKSIGTYEIVFDGNKLASGTYFYRIQAGGFSQTKKLILLK